MTAPTHADPAAARRGRFRVGLYLAYMVLTIYWVGTTTGPALWLARAQAAVFGGMYSGKFSVLLLNLPALLLVGWASDRQATAPTAPTRPPGTRPKPGRRS